MGKYLDRDLAEAEQAQTALREGLETARKLVAQTKRLISENPDTRRR